ncbi:6368_t:CDS:2 [Racocetra persica]|uniref:6368_t:CDS:1 n=1 Tax=Racocetra persica TaxID=160502 RepID=A0ACA9KJV9_9GLOM|nr:6368_t:CDS:2 [Racocetra persica]
MRGYIFSFLLIAFATFSATAIEIVYPSSQYYWVYGSSQYVMWTSNSTDPSSFNIYLRNNDLPQLAVGSGLALANSVATSLQKTNITLSDNYGKDTGFFIYFSHPSNASMIYTTSELFSIKPSGTAPSVYTPPSTPTPTPEASPTKSAAGTSSTYKSLA